ncbi:hypothetical protein NQ317_005093 [Molorchus minor]|uniref:Kinetochore protein Nuf2 N-terminal domain-containing protein n=1 Tax=Molorchus minor TaxID=1323400 RepID=A0ABQ9JFC3_9CUCU|nr:hypothetical protein NQ317_005093 [Molorchus minor]
MSDRDLAALLSQIKDYWPQFQITKENLLRPTKEMAFRFYSSFVSECYEKIAQITGCPPFDEFGSADHTPEDHLFLQLCRLREAINCPFTLIDIYQPTPKRTKHFFNICIHFLIFLNHLESEAISLGSQMYEIKEYMGSLSKEIEELNQEINKYAKVIVDMTDIRENTLKPELAALQKTWKDLKLLKSGKEKVYAEKKSQIEKLKLEISNEEYDLNRLEVLKKEFQTERTTKEEHQTILQTLEYLKSESEYLDNDDVYMNDRLIMDNEKFKNRADCLRLLSKYNFNIQSVKDLTKKEEQFKTILNSVDLLKIKINSLKQQSFETDKNTLEARESLSKLQGKYRESKELYVSNIDKLKQEQATIVKTIHDQSENNAKTILSYEEDIAKLKEELDKLRKTFMEGYIRLSKKEASVLDRFKNALKKAGKSDE